MKKQITTLLLMLMTTVVMAVPAKKGLWRTITLENGQEVKALLKGDEFGHFGVLPTVNVMWLSTASSWR